MYCFKAGWVVIVGGENCQRVVGIEGARGGCARFQYNIEIFRSVIFRYEGIL